MPPYTLALAVAWGFFVSMSESFTFQHRDPGSSQMLTCQRCPAGFYMKVPCTTHQETICAPCPLNHFTQFDNNLPKCQYCSNFCREHQVVKQECTAMDDRVCECKHGYHKRADVCVKNRDCPPGQGVKQKGTQVQNTVCETYKPGSFSAVKSSTAACVDLTDCATSGQRVALRGSEWHDNICMSCQEQKANGTLAPLRQIISVLFSHKKLRLGKMKRLVWLHTDRTLKTMQPDLGRSASMERFRLLAAIDKWAQEESEATLRQLAHTLKGQMYPVALELEIKR